MRLLRALCCTAPLLLAAGAAPAQQWSDSVRLNQLGFYPGAPKTAVVISAAPGRFHVMTPDLVDTVYTGELGPRLLAAPWSDTTRAADFSALQRPGAYVVWVPGTGYSYPFEIRPKVHAELARASVKAFYFHRASAPAAWAYAGAWSRPGGHPDSSVLVHPSAASPGRPAGSVISSPGGWYDAGDYNKYIVNSGITVGTLLSLYEDFPAFAGSLELQIPESGDAVPDLLDEALWNLRWMLTMQDPADGGVYHKLTEPDFEGFVTPAAARSPRYVVQKSTAATLDFAAVMAQASRVLRPFEHALPGLADSTLVAAQRAWRWARLHPGVLYDQAEMNRRFDPDVDTGAYGDRDVADEFAWAATELFVTTRQDSFYTAVPVVGDSAMLPSWPRVGTLAYYTLARFRADLPQPAAADLPRVRQLLLSLADSLRSGEERRPYRTVMGGSRRDFVWGSNAVAANQGIALVQAYRLTGDRSYLRSALANLDYLLGRNATGFSFVTGYGDRLPMHPHHRVAASDPVAAPIPGWLVGGPNPGMQDRCPDYPSELPEKAFLDDVCSYASNEVAINWNAPLAYLATALEALQFEIGHAPSPAPAPVLP